MVERARAEHRDDRGGEDRGGDRLPGAVGVDDEQGAHDQGEEEGGLVQNASQKRPDIGIVV